MTASDRFEDRLLAQLRQVVAERPAPVSPAPKRGHRTRLVLASAGGAAAVAAIAIVASSGEVTTSAYAVQPRADGVVTVSIHKLSDPAGLRHSLQAVGIPAVVSYLPTGRVGYLQAGRAGCAKASPSRVAKQHAAQTKELSKEIVRLVRALRATQRSAQTTMYEVDPDRIQKNESLYVTTADGTVDTIAMVISPQNAIASCAAP